MMSYKAGECSSSHRLLTEMSDVQPVASFAGFPLPPPHWQLFKPDSQVLVLPPKIPAGEVFVFGEESGQSRTDSPLDADEWLCNPDAADLGAEIINLHGLLQTSCLELLDCLAQNPSEYPTRIRRLGHVLKNMQGLLHVLQQREAKAAVMQQLRDQVGRKRAFLEEAKTSLPNLRRRLGDFSTSSISCSSAKRLPE